MLVGFPIALFTATIALELAQIGTHDAFYDRAAMVANIAGVVMALLAMIPGAIDLVALPAHSPARATGIKHAAFNLLTVAVFAISAVLLVRGFDSHIPLAFGMIGIVTMAYAGALGYALVHAAPRSRRALPARHFGAAVHH